MKKHLKETQRQLELTSYMKTPPDENSEKPLCEVRIKNSSYINSDYGTLYEGIPGTDIFIWTTYTYTLNCI